MKTGKYDPSGTELTLHDRRSAIWIFAYYASPSGKLRAVLPKLINLAALGLERFLH